MFFLPKTKTEIYSIISAIFCVCLVVSNIIAQKPLQLGIITLPASILIYPISFMIGDVLTEIYGFNKAKQVIILGFLLNLFVVAIFEITILLPTSPSYINSEALNIVLNSTPRLLIASFISYLSGSFLNAYIMVYLKKKFENRLFFRCIISTIVGELVDSCIFITIAFIGNYAIEYLILMIIYQVIFKSLYEVIIYPIAKRVIITVKSLPD